MPVPGTPGWIGEKLTVHSAIFISARPASRTLKKDQVFTFHRIDLFAAAERAKRFSSLVFIAFNCHNLELLTFLDLLFILSQNTLP
jgi:hypothetical protein